MNGRIEPEEEGQSSSIILDNGYSALSSPCFGIIGRYGFATSPP